MMKKLNGYEIWYFHIITKDHFLERTEGKSVD